MVVYDLSNNRKINDYNFSNPKMEEMMLNVLMMMMIISNKI